ncbi:MAG: alanine--tRNA ligase, partial [Lutibacter sp.]|nr:alanine--tRNA ligase [Lutibacter sp.]
MKSHEIRQQFLDFFASKGHAIVPSAPMVLKNDPSLMFTNAGMVPFKEYFLGQKKATDKRLADTQKCLRVSGKHNDLEAVGKDTYHHTLFEMLGNWSFGDYFKESAISWAWELLTSVYKIDKDRLYVTVFEGAEKEGLAFDQEAHDLWKKQIDPSRILNGNKKDNFWEMGAQGPCGPCSEIHVDLRSAEERARVSGKSLVNKDHPQVVEIWNLVFMEFNRKADGSLEKLPQKHVDTGMGFERLCMVLQGVQSNYDTDVFSPIIKEIEQRTGKQYGQQEATDIAIRVIADHLRAVAFAIADGQLPSNNGAGYVIRRILRRAVRYGFTFLDMTEPFIYKLVEGLCVQMGPYFPELTTEKSLISNVIKEEENAFLRTLEQGLSLLDAIIAQTPGSEISGEKAFELYDTYGFPVDLTELILAEKNKCLDKKAFTKALEAQKKRSKKAAEVATDDWVVLTEEGATSFVGYDQ